MAWIRCSGNMGGRTELKTATGSVAVFNTNLPAPVIDAKSDIGYSAKGYRSAAIINTSNTPATNKTPYLFRPSYANGYGYETLIGGTCGVNQLVDTGDTSVNTISGHKYLTRINHVESIITGGSAVSINDSSEDNIIDLTAYFGTTIADYVYTLESGTAGAGITWLKNNGFFTADYYPYNSGALLSVKTSKKINTGKNLFGGEYNVSFPLFLKKGTVVTASVVKTTENVPFIYYYDENDVMIDYWGLSEIDGNRNKRTFTIDRDCYSVKFTTAQCSDMQIEFGSSMTAYEPYVSHEYPLDDIELRGILKLDGNNNLYYDGDTYESNGSVTRKYGIVDLGTLDWEKRNTVTNKWRFVADLNSVKWTDNVSAIPDAICSGYIMVSPLDTWNGINGLTIDWESNRLFICDLGISDESEFNNLMSGIQFVYPLATPTTETADAFTNPMIVDGNGTEEFVDGRTVEMPVGHETIYGEDMKARFTDFGVTVYGGSIDFTSGTLISNKNADGTDKTPETISVTPVALETRKGSNNICSNTNGNSTIKYVDYGTQ